MIQKVGKQVAIFLLAGLVFAPLSAQSSEQEQEQGQEEAVEELPFIEIPGLTAPVIRDGRLNYFLHLYLKIEVEKSENLGLVESQIPRLRDIFLLVLHRGPPISSDGKNVNLEDLVESLREAANQMLGEDLVHRVVVINARKG